MSNQLCFHSYSTLADAHYYTAQSLRKGDLLMVLIDCAPYEHTLGRNWMVYVCMGRCFGLSSQTPQSAQLLYCSICYLSPGSIDYSVALDKDLNIADRKNTLRSKTSTQYQEGMYLQ